MKKEKDKEYNKIDWMITLLPLGTIIVLCILFFFMPEQSNTVVSQIRFVLGDTFGTYYLVIGLGVFSYHCLLQGPNMEGSCWEGRMKSRNIPFCMGIYDVYGRSCR